MINIAISDNSIEILQRLDGLPAQIHALVEEKFRLAVEEIYAKVHGVLPSFSIEHGVERQGSLVIGWFEPADAKAMAREFGGKSFYEIYPSKARLLRFIGSKDGRVVYASSVWHPPSREFRDIRDAIDARLETLEPELEELISGELP